MPKSFSKLIALSVLFFAVFIFSSNLSFATTDLSNDPQFKVINASTIPEVICLGITFISTKLMPPIAVLLVLWAGFLYMTAGGAPDNVKKAQNTLVSVVLGMIILLIAPALVALTINIAGGAANLPTGTGDPTAICNVNSAVSNITAVLVSIINWFAWLLAVLSVLLGLYAGGLYMTSQGDPEQVKKASRVFVFTIIGVAVSVLAFSIISIVKLITS